MKLLDLLHDDINSITKQSFENAIALCYRDGITTNAPLGFSGDTVILHGYETENNSRVSQVSIRNYCNDAELLITDVKGSFLFYGRFRMDDVDFVAEQYWQIFKLVKHKIKSQSIRLDFEGMKKQHEHAELTVGFEMLKAWSDYKKQST